MHLRVEFADGADDEFFLGLLILLLNPLIVLSRQLRHVLECLFNIILMLLEVTVLQTLSPVDLVQIEKHLLLELILTVVHRDRVVVLAEAVCDRDKRGLLDVADV